jgi:hypothetical protein
MTSLSRVGILDLEQKRYTSETILHKQKRSTCKQTTIVAIHNMDRSWWRSGISLFMVSAPHPAGRMNTPLMQRRRLFRLAEKSQCLYMPFMASTIKLHFVRLCRCICTFVTGLYFVFDSTPHTLSIRLAGRAVALLAYIRPQPWLFKYLVLIGHDCDRIKSRLSDGPRDCRKRIRDPADQHPV